MYNCVMKKEQYPETYNELPVSHDEKRSLLPRNGEFGQFPQISLPSFPLSLSPTLNRSRTLPAHNNRDTSISQHTITIIIIYQSKLA